MRIVQSVSRDDSVVRASGLGGTIRQMRKASSYRGLEAFASQASMSKEGLRKIESGDRLPTRETLTKLLEAGNAPDDQITELQQLRDRTQAKRDGLDVQNARDINFDSLAAGAVSVFDKYLGEYDMELPEDDQRHLKVEVKKALRARL